MPPPNLSLDLPINFSGVVRLFPLPNLVLFPAVIQPLRIFERRYLQLIRDALSTDRLITMALLRPNWALHASSQPAIYPTVCIGKIVSHTPMEGGRMNCLLVGAQRARIVRELPADQPYRRAEVRVLSEPDDRPLGPSMTQLRQRIVMLFRRLASHQKQMDGRSLELLVDRDMPLSPLLDLIAFSSGARPTVLQSVLETTQLERRARMVLALLRTMLDERSMPESSARPTFPPDFSLN